MNKSVQEQPTLTLQRKDDDNIIPTHPRKPIRAVRRFDPLSTIKAYLSLPHH